MVSRSSTGWARRIDGSKTMPKQVFTPKRESSCPFLSWQLFRSDTSVRSRHVFSNWARWNSAISLCHGARSLSPLVPRDTVRGTPLKTSLRAVRHIKTVRSLAMWYCACSLSTVVVVSSVAVQKKLVNCTLCRSSLSTANGYRTCS